MDNKKFYEILEIPQNASSSDIKQAYRKAALKYHPDRNPNNKEATEEKFKEIGKAYSILSDNDKKKIYDKFGEEGINGDMGEGVSPFDIFEQMFSGGDNPMGGFPFGNMFNMGSNGMRPNKTELLKVKVKLTFKEMMMGGERTISYKKTIIKNKDNIDDCIKCNGNGKINKIIQMAPGLITQTTQPCGYCKGIGKIVELEKITENITFNVTPGTKGGEHVVIKNKGNESIYDNDIGDLIIIFQEDLDPNMERQGNNLVILKNILLSEALTGLEFILNHPSKNNILIKTNNIIKPDDIKVLYGLGFPKKNKFMNGDIIIKFKIIFPDNIDDAKKNLINKLLPRRTKLKNIENITTYYLEENNINEIDTDNDSDSENHNPQREGVQCAQQ